MMSECPKPRPWPAAPQDSTSSILQAYVVHLIDAGQHQLVPQYCCHLRAGARHLTYRIFLARLTSAPMADCQVRVRAVWVARAH